MPAAASQVTRLHVSRVTERFDPFLTLLGWNRLELLGHDIHELSGHAVYYNRAHLPHITDRGWRIQPWPMPEDNNYLLDIVELHAVSGHQSATCEWLPLKPAYVFGGNDKPLDFLTRNFKDSLAFILAHPLNPTFPR